MEHLNNTQSDALVLASRTAVLVRAKPNLYQYFFEKARNLGIELPGGSLQSRILFDLLQRILDLETIRQNPARVMRGEAREAIHRIVTRPFAHLSEPTQDQPILDTTFDYAKYTEGPQASFYTQLLDVQRKLEHEIKALEALGEAKARIGRSESPRSFRSDQAESLPGRSKRPSSSRADSLALGTRVRSRSVHMHRDRSGELNDDGSFDREPRDPDSEYWSESESKSSHDSRGQKGDVLVAPEDLDNGDSPPPDWLLLHVSTDSTGDSFKIRSGRKPTQISEVFYAKRHLGEAEYVPSHGRLRVRDILERYPAISFIIVRRYNYEFPCPSWTRYTEDNCVAQIVRYISEALERILVPYDIPSMGAKKWDLVLFHRRNEVKAQLDSLRPHLRAQLQLLLDATEEDYVQATSLFKQGLVTPIHLYKLFSWNTVVVLPDEPVETYRCGAQPLRYNAARATVHIEVTRWSFNGKFHLITSQMAINASHKAMKICNLEVYPLQYATPEIRELVAKRSLTFWACRRKAFVSYGAPGQVQRSQGPANYRFMIDYDTYRELHPDAEEFIEEDFKSSLEMNEEVMDNDSPPGNGMDLIFPSHISGYSIQDKKWKTLLVDYIRPVTWNKLAFERLVLKPAAKELIQAVVQVHDSKERSADLMQGKGNGSLILLHGPPGTGKTLTAESVAELVQRPLYRVSCGDVGTDPENVESYLESVLYIGKIWGCVVLLDEADVFLEERTLTDLHRNALVSVFLRVLEYYDGILILTSNRVGTFDEAFKSRIKLALHYSTQGRADRRKIWRNFFKTLKETDPEHVDFDDLEDHLDDLADVKLNGRDIRNSISVARELAHFRKNDKLNYEHIKHVIGVGEEFESYLDKTHGHKTDEWLKENGIRA